MKLKPPQESRRTGVERPAPKPDRERRHDQEGKALVGHAWQPIRPLSRADRAYDFTLSRLQARFRSVHLGLQNGIHPSLKGPPLFPERLRAILHRTA